MRTRVPRSGTGEVLPQPSRERTPNELSGASDGLLVEAMRRGEGAAFREFLLRFQPLLLEQARRVRVRDDLLDECVWDVLSDAATGLASGKVGVPRSIAAYLVTTLRNRVLNAGRDEARRERRVQEALAEVAGSEEQTVATACSEGTLRASRGILQEEPSLPSALHALATVLDATLTEEERQLLIWLGHRVPQREIAQWLGLSYAATAQRVWRLRSRLREAAVAHAAAADPRDRAELSRFLARARSVCTVTSTTEAEASHEGEMQGRAWEP